MALPYATESQLNALAKKVDSIQTSGGTAPTKVSQLTNDIGYITSAALTDYAKKSEIPDTSKLATKSSLSKYATKEQVDGLIKTVGEGLQIGDGNHTTNINTTADNKVMINSVGEVVYSTPYPGEEGRKVVQFKNNDQLSGVTTTGQGVPLVFVSKWDKVEVGGSGAPLNLNGNTERPTYNDSKEFAFAEDTPVVCGLPFRTILEQKEPKKYSKETVFGWFGVSAIVDLKKVISTRSIFLHYGISLSYNPMYYTIPCQYVAFKDANTIEMITDGLDTKNDKISRYHILIALNLETEATVEDTEVTITCEDYLHLPALPEDATEKTYTLKAVNGTLSWAE